MGDQVIRHEGKLPSEQCFMKVNNVNDIFKINP